MTLRIRRSDLDRMTFLLFRMIDLSFNAGGASSLGVLSYLTAVSMENFYSPRDLARYVGARRGSRSEKKAIAALQAYRKKNGVKKNPIEAA